MGDYSNFIVIVLIVALRFLMDRLIVRGEDRRRLTDLEKKYLPNTKRHIATLLSIGCAIIVLSSYMLFYPMT